MKTQLPELNTDDDAENFVATADLTEYDLSKFKTVDFKVQPKTERVNVITRAIADRNPTAD